MNEGAATFFDDLIIKEKHILHNCEQYSCVGILFQNTREIRGKAKT